MKTERFLEITTYFSVIFLVLGASPAFAGAEDPTLGRRIMEASSRGDLAQVNALCDGGNVNRKDADGRTPLMAAALNGHLAVVKLLIERGTEVNERDKSGYTVLRQALFSDKANVVKLLLDEGASGNARDNYGEPVLHVAASLGNAAAVQLLLDKGADINSKDERGWSALKYAASDEHVEVMKVLLAHGAEVTLDVAAMIGDKETIQRLLQTGIDVNSEDNSGATALMEAVRHGQTDTAQLLLDSGADMNASEVDGMTVLMSAASMGKSDIVKLLVDRGADIDEKDYLGMTAAGYAAIGRHEEVAKWLKEAAIRSEEIESSVKASKREAPQTITGTVVAYSADRLSIREIANSDDKATEVVTIDYGGKIRFIPFCRPAVGEKVEVSYSQKNGRKIGSVMKILSPSN
jgi:ankyrin repeat protein